MGRLIDLTGKRFLRLLVISKFTEGGPSYQARWTCVCDCGNTTVVDSQLLRRGKTKSCGCYLKEILDKSRYKHGEHQDKLYEAWTSIKQRCLNPNNPVYRLYGARGITICDEWINDYPAFAAYMRSLPQDGTSIDRIDNDRGYEPGNVRWATRHQQSRNRSSNRMITHNGRTMCLRDWTKESGIPHATLHYRLFTAKWPIERALTEKPKSP